MDLKKIAAERAVEYINSGMNIGIGTGSTVYWAIQKIGELVQQGLEIKAIPTSRQTEKLARECGIELIDFSRVDCLDLTIDGADEISPTLDLIKGGGGALLREKIVAQASKKFIVIADSSKMVNQLGTFPLPVEVVPFGWEYTAKNITAMSLNPKLRLTDRKTPFVTDNGNYILDCHVGKILDPLSLHQQLKRIVGVVETGIFLQMTDLVIIGSSDGVKEFSGDSDYLGIWARS